MTIKAFLQITAASFVGVSSSLLVVNGLTAAHHIHQAYQMSSTCDFKPYAVFHAEKAAALNPTYGYDLMQIAKAKSC